MNKELLNIDFGDKTLSYFSYGDEKLYIDLLIKEDEEARLKAKEYAGYLEELKEYVEFDNEKEVDEIIQFLESKFDILNSVSQEEKRKYMEMKFDVLDGKIKVYRSNDDDSDDYYLLSNNNDDKKIKLLKKKIIKFFPILNNLDNIFFKHYYENILINTYEEKVKNSTPDYYKNEDEEYQVELEYQDNIQAYNQSVEDNFINFNFYNSEIIDSNNLGSKKYLLVPFLIPYGEKLNDIPPYCKFLDTSFINWKIKRFKIKNIKQNKKIEHNLDLLNKFIFLEQDMYYEKEFIQKLFPKINLFCDYRFFDRKRFK